MAAHERRIWSDGDDDRPMTVTCTRERIMSSATVTLRERTSNAWHTALLITSPSCPTASRWHNAFSASRTRDLRMTATTSSGDRVSATTHAHTHRYPYRKHDHTTAQTFMLVMQKHMPRHGFKRARSRTNTGKTKPS
jgi:hypothetical protein